MKTCGFKKITCPTCKMELWPEDIHKKCPRCGTLVPPPGCEGCTRGCKKS